MPIIVIKKQKTKTLIVIKFKLENKGGLQASLWVIRQTIKIVTLW